MPTRPSKLPFWADDPTTPIPGTAVPPIAEPSDAVKHQGWVLNKPPVGIMNWLFNLIYQWLGYLGQAGAAIQHFRGRANNVPVLARALGIPFSRAVGSSAYNQVALSGTPTGRPCYDGQYIWVPNSSSNVVDKIDPSILSVVASIALGAGMTGQSCTFDGAYIWVACYHATTPCVKKIDPATNAVLATVALTGNPIAADYDGNGHLWVISYTGQSLFKIDIATNAVLATYTMTAGFALEDILFDGAWLWIMARKTADNSAAVFRVDPADGSIKATITAGLNDFPIQMEFDGTFVRVLSTSTGYVSKINVLTDLVVSSFLIASTHAVAMCFDGILLWILGTDANGGGFTIYNPDTDVLIEDHAGAPLVSVQSKSAVFDGSHIWVGSSIGNMLTRFLPAS